MAKDVAKTWLLWVVTCHGDCGQNKHFCFDKLLHVHPKGEIIFDNLQNKDISGETIFQFMREKQVFLMALFSFGMQIYGECKYYGSK